MEKEIISKAKELLSPFTPLYKDCGLICDKGCCKGDEETGMLLFPGEETVFPVKEKNGVRLCVCKGKCNRNSRPLSCMLFPFFPYMNEEGKIRVCDDIRGINICPLISHKDEIIFSKIFLRRVARVGRLLKKDSECKDFLFEVSREIDRLRLFLE